MTDDTKDRHREQQIIWYFTCQCRVCIDEKLDRKKHSLKCNICGSPRPIDLKTWQFSTSDLGCNGGCEHCGLTNDDQATEQDVRMYKYLRDKVVTIRRSDEVKISRQI